MIETGFDKRVKVQQIIDNQLPEFLLSESPKASEFLKQYYISQEYQGGPVDLADNLDQYLKLDNLTPEVVKGYTTLSTGITTSSNTVVVSTTKGFPSEYGLLKIDDEIITYTGITTNSFTGCIRGFSGITTYRNSTNPSELTFSSSSAGIHTAGVSVQNLSALFLQEFYKKIRYSLAPGLENVSFTSNLDVSNFIKESRSFYASKGTEESFKILFKVLYGENIQVLDLEKYLIKPSVAKFLRRQVVIAEKISGDPANLVGQTIRKSTDLTTQGSVSEVEIISRSGRTYYKISLFIGYDDSNLTEGEFNITPKTKIIDTVSVGSSIITVDSTIGFGNTGTLISGNNIVSYTDKSVNQFLNCNNIVESISKSSTIRSTEVVFGYENGDTTKKVELLITGVLSEFYGPDLTGIKENEKITVKNLGKVIENPQSNKSYVEIFANSWIYNTSSRYYIQSFSGSTLTLQSTIDKSSLKVGDSVEIVVRGTQNVVATNATVQSVNTTTNQVILSGLIGFTPSVSLDYDLRRNLNKATSSAANLKYGNDKIVSDIQNLYVDDGQEYAYVASNSLPSYNITKNIIFSEISEATGVKSPSATTGFLQGFNSTTLKFSVISFNSNTQLVTGDRIVYLASNQQIPGLMSGASYFVEVLASGNKIRLYESRSFIGTEYYVEFDSLSSGTGSHKFVLYKHRSLLISPQKLLKKFSLNPSYQSGDGDKTVPGGVGMLINGVEIVSPKTDDKIYYGPLSSVEIINGGRNYDVINPPYISVSSGTGTTALVQPVVSGIVTAVYVEPQEFDIGVVVSATISGGNGSGAILEPYVARRYRELEFDARQNIFGGGIDVTNETITFNENHNLQNGDSVIYNNNDNNSIGIGTYFNSNSYYKTLSNGETYYVQVVGLTTIKLYQTSSDRFSGINTVGFTTENTSGIHKFITFEKDTLRAINVISPGSGYQNRKLRVKTSGISTIFNSVQFDNHNFNDGDIVRYETTGTNVGGLSTTNSYYVIKNDSNSFHLADAGIGATISENYNRKKYVQFSSVGSGYHIFKYPDIEVSVNVSYGNTFVGVVTATPSVKGHIIDAYLYEPGTGYGSTIVNFEKKPLITIKNGKSAEAKALIKNGKIQSVDVLSSGSEYYSVPDIVVKGDGTGAVLKANIVNQKLVSITVINGGIGYVQETTSISIVASGTGAILEANVRSLEINQQFEKQSEVLVETLNDLKYAFVGYSTSIFSTNYGDTGLAHSPIIGWAYDGNPIYGPYGFSDPENIASPITLMNSGYSLQTSSIIDRPSAYAAGYFIEDHQFTSTGTLDIHNGRICKTPEFPKGTYAYFVGVSTDPSTNTLIPQYPYFIGNTYRSQYVDDNTTLDQSFDFNNSNLVRNTLGYKVNDPYANNDFFVESNEIIKQLSIVESVTKGGITGFEVLNQGSGYKVGDNLHFNDEGTNGGGLTADVESITGKEIININTSVETFNNTVFTWKDSSTVLATISPKHTFLDNDNISISGLSSSITYLNKVHKVGVTTEKCILFKNMPVAGISTVEDIYVSRIPASVSIGSSLTIGAETVSVLNRFDVNSIIRVKRSSGTAHTATTEVNVLPDTFAIPVNVGYFDSKVNNIAYFNPKQSVGVGTTAGVSISTSFTVGEINKIISIPTQSIYLPNHPFKTGDQLTLTKLSSATALIVSQQPASSTFNLPQTGNTETVYAINKSKDYIGLTTSVGLTTNTDGLYFSSNGSNDYEYSLRTNYTQVTGKSEKVTAVVSVSTAHSLVNGDIVTLEVKPNTTVGFGTTNVVNLKYNSKIDKIVFNPIGFTSASINTSNSTISIGASHLNTGDKVFYNSTDLIASGLTTSTYFVYKIDDSTIKLAETRKDIEGPFPRTVSITSIGGTQHQLEIINPPIKVQNNSDLKFDLSDSSLSGYKLKLFFDDEFNNEFVSVANTTTFNIIGVGTVGVGTTASLTLKHSDGLPLNLFYAVEKSGFISTADKEVKNYSKISFVDNEYNGTYSIFGVGSTTFSISLSKVPQETYLSSSNTDVLEYSTTSVTATGGIKKVRNIFGGYNYKSLPGFSSVTTASGQNANIVPLSDQIGKINKVRILEQGFEYPSDKTLRPDAYVSPTYYISNSNTINSVTVLSGGKNYSTPPNLIIVDPETNQIVNNDSLTCNLSGTSIGSVNVIYPPKGLSSSQQNIVAINNSNGIGINTILTSPSGIVTCFLTTPLTGFTTAVFAAGDQIFVENIEKNDPSGTGFNSADYGYRFFTVTNFTNTNPAKLEYNVVGLTTNAGIAKTSQNSYAFIVNRNNYPIFEPVQGFSTFSIDETILVKSSTGTQFVERDLAVQISERDYVKFIGTYTQIKIGDTLKGKKSGVIATVSDIDDRQGKFKVDYFVRKDNGWLTETGKLSELSQVSSDNDYYQNMSYSIKSTIQYDEIVNSVNRLLHPTGMKNFSDTQINSRANRVSIASSTNDIIVLDVINEKRVDTINNFDLTLDVDTLASRSKFIKFKNKKLTDYVKCTTNRVLLVDDISSSFQNNNSSLNNYTYLDFIEGSFSKYVYQITDINSSAKQVGEIVALYTNDNVYSLTKSLITSGLSTSTTQTVIGEVVADKDSFDIPSLRFIPVDPYDDDYDIKVIKTEFNSDLSGIGTQSIGFVNLVGVNTSVGVGTTVTVFSASSSTNRGIFANIQVINKATLEMNYIELYVDHDGTDTFTSEYYFDTSSGLTTSHIGIFQPTISSGSIRLNYFNNSSNEISIRSKIVGFGTTAVGVGTYRFLSPGQIAGNERSAYYQSNYNVSSGSTSVIGVSTENISAIKSTVKVSYGNTSSLHQIVMAYDGTDTVVSQYPFLSIGSTNGIGTFSGSVSGSNLILSFHPDSYTGSANVLVQSFNEILYADNDNDNEAPNLDYGTITESIKLSQYSGLNGTRVNKKSFVLKYEGVPIFSKTFNPSSSTVLNPSTGIFQIDNHFFSNGEKLTYAPNSTLIGVGATSVGIGSTSTSVVGGVGIGTTNILPSTVYLIKIDNNSFKLATTPEYATAGIGVTFTSVGGGNAHTLTMSKRNEKAIVTLDGVIQKPLTFTPLSYNLANNGGQIGTASSIFALSGISSIKPRDIIKINNEYMDVVSVGIGTTFTGPISGIGTFSLVSVSRSAVGSSSTVHADGSSARVYRGSYNIENSTIYFTDAPYGNSGISKNPSTQLPYARSTFDGRVYLRQNYSTNYIYDDISDTFSGIGRTYSLTVQGISTSGINTTAVLLINDIFQTPTTQNNVGNNYEIIPNPSSGVSTVSFTGITSTNNQIIISDYDVNQNQIPRGGVIVSLGSTNGLGFAPLVGASVTAVVGAGGSIVSVGLGTTDRVGSGYYGTVSIGLSETSHSVGLGSTAVIIATVGAGGTLAFTVSYGGTGYTNPKLIIPEPKYSDLQVTGVSRFGVGATSDTGSGLLISLDVGTSSTTGIGSTLFEVKSFKITRPGYGFRIGDVFKPVGLVTAKGLASPLADFELTVLDIFTDSFAAWQFGDLDFIDPITSLQDGTRKRFPLYYNAQLLSFEIDPLDPDSVNIDLNSVLLVFRNGVLQKPGDAYEYDGGTSILFSEAPRSEDSIAIFFYRGTTGVDTQQVNITETIKIGDDVQIFQNDNYPETITQDSRRVDDISGSDRIETNIYSGAGIDTNNYKPLYWTKQKVDKIINGDLVYKSRDSIEGQIYPTAKVIKNVSPSDTEIFVDDVQLFDYEQDVSSIAIAGFSVLLVQDAGLVSAGVTATVSAAGTISALTITNSGAGYTGTVNIKIGAPKTIGVGVGTTATATVSISNGSISSPVIVNPGFGYNQSTPPSVIVESPSPKIETITNISSSEIMGFSGIITGITTSTGTGGHPLGLKLFLNSTASASPFANLSVGYPILVFETGVGSGVTSVNGGNASVVGIGTTFLDNIYYVHSISASGQNAQVVTNIHSGTSVVGLATTAVSSASPVGKFSWGRLFDVSRSSSPVSIGVTGLTIDSGLSTFPTIQRRGYGLRDRGPLKKTFG